MAGTRAGGLKAAETNKLRYGDGFTKENFYSQIGRKGGRISRGGGFAQSHELAVWAGTKGGKISKRNKERDYEARYSN